MSSLSNIISIDKHNSYSCTKTLPVQCIIVGFLLTILVPAADSILCDRARINCALRNGCGFSLRNYMMECTDLIAGRTQRCNARCERALIGLISSDEGKELINCDCDGNKYCELSKQRIEVCRKSVYAAVAKDTIVSCSTARWICISDLLCKTALEYYQRFCRQLFIGQKCTHRCNNSLSILDRQEKASKLRTCYCDGTENFPCARVKFYTEHMCYGRLPHNPFNAWEDEDDSSLDDNNDNSIEPIGHVGNNHHSYYHNHHRYHHKLSNKINQYHLGTSSAYSQLSWYRKQYQYCIMILAILFNVHFHRLPAVFR